MTELQATPLRELVEARRDEIKAIVARHQGRSVAIFGSVARGDERPGRIPHHPPDSAPYLIW